MLSNQRLHQSSLLSLLFAAAVALICCSFPALLHAASDTSSSTTTPPKQVAVLDKTNWDSHLRDPSKDAVFVKFYAPWCGHCKTLAPEFEKSAAEDSMERVQFAKINCDDNEEICKQFDINGYPTLLIFPREGSADSTAAKSSTTPEYVRYEGGRKASEIVEYMKNFLSPLMHVASSRKELDSLLAKHPLAAVAFFDSPEAKAFYEVAKANKQEATFIAVINPALAEEARKASQAATEGLIMQFHSGVAPKNEVQTYAGKEASVEGLQSFVRNASIPAVGEIGPENYSKYVTSGVPIGFAFYEGAKQREELLASLESVAPAYRAVVNCVLIDAAKFKPYAAALNVTPAEGKEDLEFPVFVIHNVTADTKFVLDKQPINASTLGEFMKAFKEGKVEPTFKSEKEPEENNGAVKTVVFNSFEKIVLDKSKDVLVDFYAPWCGVCTRIEPIYQKAAELLADWTGISLVKMDATLNDTPPELGIRLEAYPTLKLFKAGSNEIVDCEAFRDLKSLLAFLKEKTVNNKFEISAEVIEKAVAELATKAAAGKGASEGSVPDEEGEEGEEETSGHDEL